MERGGIRGIMMDAVQASAERAAELGAGAKQPFDTRQVTILESNWTVFEASFIKEGQQGG